MTQSPAPFYSIWRVNMRHRTFVREPVPQSWQLLGGRGLVARILLDEVEPTCEPLRAQNKLIFAPGLLVGHMLSSCDRISIGGKSPLTGGVKEANAGGRTGLQLSRLGIKALIIEDVPEDKGLYLLHISADGVHFNSAENLRGMGVYAAGEQLLKEFGEEVAIALIGPGGEMRLRAAGIQNVDKDGAPTRIAARGGLGAVMASKGLKAIVIDGKGGTAPPIEDAELFKNARKRYTKALMEHPQTKTYHDYGTAGILQLCQTFGVLPTRNFSQGTFEHAEQLSGEHLREVLLKRGGRCDPSHACMVGCAIKSSNVFVTEDGQTTVSPLEYETIGLMGSNLGIASLDDVARLNYMVNDLGLDSIEIGSALGVAAEAGLMPFGDAARALELLDEIRRGTPLGRVLGNGTVITGQVFGVERVPAVKNQAISAYDPRAVKGTGVTYATSPQGADHTAGLTLRAKVDHTDPKGQVELSRKVQYNMAGYDTLGVCIFAGFGFAVDPETIPILLRARYGWEAPSNILAQLGRETILLEREFNHKAGFTAADDRLPQWMQREPLPPTNAVFDVSTEEMDAIFEQ